MGKNRTIQTHVLSYLKIFFFVELAKYASFIFKCCLFKKKKKVLFVNKVTVNQKPFGILALVFYQPFKN